MSATDLEAPLVSPTARYELEGIAVCVHGLTDYLPAWRAMQRYTAGRGPQSPDQIWTFEHPSVFTLGQAGDPAHILDPRDVPVVASDRGGQVTYHGPGQVVVYSLLDLRRRGLGVKRLVGALEQSVIDLLAAHGVAGARREGAPGVYVEGSKVAALGLRVRRGCSYHGVALNVRMDLRPFSWINPCGYAGLAVTQLCDLGIGLSPAQARDRIVASLATILSELGAEAGRA